ncbi:hypothetical protein V3O24_17110 [Methylobacter sp. Wu8]|uniref:hypothetical protein n=1 Tax=Methylobacter sp. Wu8 TaxID=3118457 RepID=UPI002F323FDB
MTGPNHADNTDHNPKHVQQGIGAVLLEYRNQESITASVVLKAQTNINGLSGPIQLTSEKLKIRISTPTISMNRIYLKTNEFNALIII